jgi:hypothetical protein
MLNIIIPFRDSNERKYSQLWPVFISRVIDRVEELPINIIGIEQSEESGPFNLGKLMNVGYYIIKQSNYSQSDLIMYHPVDMMPKLDLYLSSSKTTKFWDVHHGDGGKWYKTILFTMNDYETINGFSNEYIVWGTEDSDVMHRLHINNIQTESIPDNFEFWMEHGIGVSSWESGEKNGNILRNFYHTNDYMSSGLNNTLFEILDENVISPKIKKYKVDWFTNN